MKKIIKYLSIFTFVVVATLAFSSCSRSNFGGRRYGVATLSPITPKRMPVRKKFIVNNRRRPILGLDTRK